MDAAEPDITAGPPQRIPQRLCDPRHEPVHLALARREEVGPCDNKAQLHLAIAVEPAVAGAAVPRPQRHEIEQFVPHGAGGTGEVGCIEDVVDMVVLVGRLFNRLPDRGNVRVVDGRARLMVHEVVTSIADDRVICSQSQRHHDLNLENNNPPYLTACPFSVDGLARRSHKTLQGNAG